MNELKTKLEIALKSLYESILDSNFLEVLDLGLTIAPESANADFSSNIALKLAKPLKKPPMVIAEEIRVKVGETWQGTIEIAAPGFLNFISPDEYYIEKLTKINENFADFISRDEYKGKTVVTEFSDPNPFKVLHVGHLYTSIVGDSISRLIEAAGGKVIRANFGGDVGLHVAKTSYLMLKKQDEMPSLKTLDERANWMANCYVEGTRAYEEDENARAEIVKLNKELYKISEQDDHNSKLAEVYWTGRNWSYDYFKAFYAQIGVKFDCFYPESTVSKRGLKEVEAALKKGVYEESDGAIVYRGEKVGLHTRVFINKNGLPTYEAKDVGLIFTKWDDYKFDESVVITGNDIVEYMKVVLASVAEYAPELPKRTTHLTHSNVKLPGGVKMASRKGNFLKAVDVLEMIETALRDEFGSVDPIVSLGAIKYAFLKYKIGGGDISLDVKTSVSMTGNSGPYLQYSAVRAKKILQRGRESGSNHSALLDITPLERPLVKKLTEYPLILSEAISEKAPHKICNYLYETAQEFSRFYEKCPVSNNDREVERLYIVSAYLKVLTNGLDLLGIKVPEKM